MSDTPLPDEIAALEPLVEAVRELVDRTGRAIQVQYSFADGSMRGPGFVGINNPAHDPDERFVLAVEDLEDAGSALFFGADLPSGITVEIGAAPEAATRVNWFANPNLEVQDGMIGNVRLRARKISTPPVVPLTTSRADNDLDELTSLLDAHGHNSGFDADKIAAAEKRRGVTFPDELRLFFSRVRKGTLVGDLDNDDAPYVEATGSLTSGTGKIGNVVNPTKRHGSPDSPLPPMPAPTPDDIVQPVYATKNWIVFATDGGGNDYALDLAPGPRGHIGQVVQFDHEREQPPEIVAHSLTDFLAERWVQDPRTTVPPPDAEPGNQSLYVGGHGTPEDLTPHLGSPTLHVLELSKRAPRPVTDWHHLAMLPAVHHLEATAAHWQQIVQADAYPPSLTTATIQDSRDLTVAEHVDVANALLNHHDREGFTLQHWTAS